ncbi:MAG: peptidyl-prolyl cis-trans isomerase [Bacteroidota bacterium]
MKYYHIMLVLSLFGCEYLQPKQEEEETVVATVGDEVLSESSLSELTPADLSQEDSAKFSEKFVNDWIKKQLMIQQAKEVIDFNEAEIQSKVLDYQYALMVHAFEQKYIEANLDDEVSAEEIETYFGEKSENFILRQNLAKCIYFKIPSQAPQTWRFRRSIKKYPEDSIGLWEYANVHATKVFTEDSLWVKFDEILLETPLIEVSDKAQFLKRNTYVEVSDDKFTYFLRIFDYKLVGEIAPLEFISEQVKDVIINKRKIALKRELEKNIYNEAVRSNAFEIYDN